MTISGSNVKSMCDTVEKILVSEKEYRGYFAIQTKESRARIKVDLIDLRKPHYIGADDTSLTEIVDALESMRSSINEAFIGYSRSSGAIRQAEANLREVINKHMHGTPQKRRRPAAKQLSSSVQEVE